jgi:hypothetical protein
MHQPPAHEQFDGMTLVQSPQSEFPQVVQPPYCEIQAATWVAVAAPAASCSAGSSIARSVSLLKESFFPTLLLFIASPPTCSVPSAFGSDGSRENFTEQG